MSYSSIIVKVAKIVIKLRIDVTIACLHLNFQPALPFYAIPYRNIPWVTHGKVMEFHGENMDTM